MKLKTNKDCFQFFTYLNGRLIKSTEKLIIDVKVKFVEEQHKLKSN